MIQFTDPEGEVEAFEPHSFAGTETACDFAEDGHVILGAGFTTGSRGAATTVNVCEACMSAQAQAGNVRPA
jgi:hypothetical protein